jgi:dTDP-4-dehydrorhamnose 3,5-epimerase-like enzyme
MEISKQNPLVELPEVFEDARGKLEPLIDDLDMKSAILITSHRGAIRANHYHKTDWHYCYLLSGEMEYGWREVGSQQAPQCITVHMGEMIFTPAMMEHAMRFTEDSVFLALSGNPRDQLSYENDLVRVELFS